MSLVKTVTETQRLPDSKYVSYAKHPKVPETESRRGVSMGWKETKLELLYSAFKVSVIGTNSL